MKQNNLTKNRLWAWLHRLMGLWFGPIERKQKSHLAAYKAREIARRCKAQEGRHLRFLPSVNSRFPLLLSPAKIGEHATASK